MSGETRHRGAHPSDHEWFGINALPALKQGASDLCWLLSHGYARPSALKLVGDRHSLTERQRTAVGRAACADDNRQHRAQAQITAAKLRDRDVEIDGFNLLVTLEAALSGGVLLHCQDGCVRDMSSVHGSYHAVAETDTALKIAAAELTALGVRSVHWLLDSPVSNSGRLAQRIRDLAIEQQLPWTVDTVFNPDTVLMASDQVVISSDAAVIDRAAVWFNLAAHLIFKKITTDLWLVDLRQ